MCMYKSVNLFYTKGKVLEFASFPISVTYIEPGSQTYLSQKSGSHSGEITAKRVPIIIDTF